MSIIKKIRENVGGADSIGKDKEGNIVLRRGYFYRTSTL